MTFHNLPQDDNREQRWLAKVKREGKLPKPGNCFVCSDHFTADDYERDLQVLDFCFLFSFCTRKEGRSIVFFDVLYLATREQVGKIKIILVLGGIEFYVDKIELKSQRS